jgi:hypothetical protein
LAVRICTIDRYPHKSFPSNAAGDSGARCRNLTVLDGERRVRRRLTGAGLGHNGDIPEAVIRRLGDSGSNGKTGRAHESGREESYANAMMAHDKKFPICVDDPAYRGTMWLKLGAAQQRQKFQPEQRFETAMVPRQEQ